MRNGATGVRQVLLFLLCGLLVGTAVAAPIDDGLAAVEKGDYAAAFKIFAPLAEAGDAEAQHNLAMLYLSGSGVEKDLAASAQWFRRAAEQGVPAAQFELGQLYDKGEGVTQSYHYAFVWYRKAAEQGNAQAQINLGVLYGEGLGVEQDLKQAYVWFNLAAAQGYEAAFKNRQILSKEFSQQELEELRALSQEYFRKYVGPFQHPTIPRHSRPPQQQP